MIPVVAVYETRAEGERGVVELRSTGVAAENINILTPHATPEELASVPTAAGEQPGILEAIGTVAGGAAGFGIGVGVACLVVPGMGPVLAIGAAGGALLGALAGGTLGGTAGDTISAGLPEDELFIYEDAMRQGRTVVVAMVANDAEANVARNVFTETGAESIDRAREMWWLGLHDIEKEHYQAHGGNFQKDERELQRGFMAAQLPENRGRSYEECQSNLRKRYADTWNSAAFRQGYERGCKYFEESRKPKAGAAH
jgi:hypothetical protein